jgi:hypothetical protein
MADEAKLASVKPTTKAQNRNYALADGFQRMTSNKRSNTWLLFLRYTVLTEREYRQAKEEFESPEGSPARISKRTHLGNPTRTKRNHLRPFTYKPIPASKPRPDTANSVAQPASARSWDRAP